MCASSASPSWSGRSGSVADEGPDKARLDLVNRDRAQAEGQRLCALALLPRYLIAGYPGHALNGGAVEIKALTEDF